MFSFFTFFLDIFILGNQNAAIFLHLDAQRTIDDIPRWEHVDMRRIRLLEDVPGLRGEIEAIELEIRRNTIFIGHKTLQQLPEEQNWLLLHMCLRTCIRIHDMTANLSQRAFFSTWPHCDRKKSRRGLAGWA